MPVKSEIIPGVIPANPVKFEIRKHLTDHYITSILVGGQEHFDDAKSRNAKGKPILAVGNHLSNLDAWVLQRYFEEHGIVNAVFMLGKRMMDNPLTRPFVDTVSIIPLWPPTEKVTTDQQAAERNEMNIKALKSSRGVLKNNGWIVMFPEAGRSYNGVLKPEEQIAEEVSGYLALVPDLQVLFFGITQTEVLYPRGKKFPDKGVVTLTFAQPVPASEILNEYKHLDRHDRRRPATNDIMRRIAECVPEQYRGTWQPRNIRP